VATRGRAPDAAPRALVIHARSMLRTGRAEAVAAYRQAVAVEPEHENAAANLARLEPSSGFPEEAEESGVAVAEEVPSVESTEPEDGTE